MCIRDRVQTGRCLPCLTDIVAVSNSRTGLPCRSIQRLISHLASVPSSVNVALILKGLVFGTVCLSVFGLLMMHILNVTSSRTFYSRPRIAYILLVLVFNLFFSPHIFDVPGPMFAKLPHNAVCSEIGGIHMCPLKICRAKPPIFGQFPDQTSSL